MEEAAGEELEKRVKGELLALSSEVESGLDTTAPPETLYHFTDAEGLL
jgi:hypothetical protein